MRGDAANSQLRIATVFGVARSILFHVQRAHSARPAL